MVLRALSRLRYVDASRWQGQEQASKLWLWFIGDQMNDDVLCWQGQEQARTVWELISKNSRTGRLKTIFFPWRYWEEKEGENGIISNQSRAALLFAFFFGRSLFFRLGYATSQDRISNYGNHQRSMMNLNTAAAFNCASGIAGLGMVVKNENETVLLSAMGRID